MTRSGSAKRVYVLIPFRVHSDQVEATKDVITEFVSEISAREPGTLWYQSLQDEQDPARFVHYMCFEDEAAEQTHRQTTHVDRFVEALYPMCVEEPRPQRLELVIETQSN